MESYIKIVNDKSVDRQLNKTAKKLQKQYALQKKTYSKKHFTMSPLQKTISVIFDVISVLLVVVCGFMCFSIINSKMQHIPPTFAGFSVMKISSPSMTASGFYVGENVAVQRVDAKTLKPGDIIAFYVYSESYNSFDINTCHLINEEEYLDTKYITNFSSLIGLQNKEMMTAAKSGSIIVFHEITKVFEDPAGTRWFKTKGTSNLNEDKWFVSETMVVGLHSNSQSAKIISLIIGKIANSSILTLLLILVPVALLIISILKETTRDFKVACIENEILRGKRKLNDPFCVEHKIGSNLSEKEKLKVLAQAADHEKLEYINLLWRGKKPANLQKHYIRKELMLKEFEEKLNLHNTCEKMLAEGVSITKIAKYYQAERKAIEEKQLKINKNIKMLRKRNIKSANELLSKAQNNSANNLIKQSEVTAYKSKKSLKTAKELKD